MDYTEERGPETMLGMAALVIPELERPRRNDHKLHSEFHNSVGYRGGSADKGSLQLGRQHEFDP